MAVISARLLECYYRLSNRTAFEIQLQRIEANQAEYDARAVAAAAFAD